MWSVSLTDQPAGSPQSTWMVSPAWQLPAICAWLLLCGCGAPATADPESAAAANDRSPAEAAQVAERDTGSQAASEVGSDWPDFLGPGRDSKSTEKGILTQWPKSGPPLVWKKELGTSYGIGSVSNGRYFQFDRFENQARLTCLRAKTGEELWRFEYPIEYEDLLGYNNGPRCSPVIDGDRVYIAGVEGMLHCLHTADGSVVWKLDTQKKYGFVQNFFGVGSTPLIEGDLLIVNVGGSPPNSPTTYSGRVQGNGTGVVALDKMTGEEKYRLTDELASYASPTAATIDGNRWCFVFARGGLIGFDPAVGKQKFHFPWRSQKVESVNAATPIVLDGHVLITETYGPGAALLKIRGDGYQKVWDDADRGRNQALKCHWNTPIHHEGYLYGSSGRHTGNAELRCVEAATGEVQWSVPGLTRSSLLYVDGHLVCLSENGMLRLLKANPKKFDLVATAVLREQREVLVEADGRQKRQTREVALLRFPAWAAPILSHGLLYVRGDDRLACLELIPGSAE